MDGRFKVYCGSSHVRIWAAVFIPSGRCEKRVVVQARQAEIDFWLLKRSTNTGSGLKRYESQGKISTKGVTKRCRLSLLTNSALVYVPKCGGRGRGCRVSANEYSCAHGAQINFGDLTPYLTYDINPFKHVYCRIDKLTKNSEMKSH